MLRSGRIGDCIGRLSYKLQGLQRPILGSARACRGGVGSFTVIPDRWGLVYSHLGLVTSFNVISDVGELVYKGLFRPSD